MARVSDRRRSATALPSLTLRGASLDFVGSGNRHGPSDAGTGHTLPSAVHTDPGGHVYRSRAPTQHTWGAGVRVGLGVVLLASAGLGCRCGADGPPASDAPDAHSDAHAAPRAAGGRDPGPPPWRVGVLYWSDNIPGQVAMRRGLEAEADRLNAAQATLTLVPHVAGDGEQGRARQVEQMQALLDDPTLDALIVQPSDTMALTEPLRRANALGVPVVAYDQYIHGGQLSAYITSDNTQAGTLAGEYIAHRFPDDHAIQLVLVEYPAVSSTVERLDGFLAALKAAGQRYRIAASYVAVEPVAGRQAGAAILRDFPQRGVLDVVFAVNDGGGLAVADVLAGAGRDEIVFATIDGDPASVEAIERGGPIAVDAAQFCGPMGAAALRAAHQLLRGEPVPEHQLIPTFPVTRETRSRYPGWMGPLPEAFELPWRSKTPLWSPRVREVTRP
jgi:ribose transport system substrate-binding protein